MRKNTKLVDAIFAEYVPLFKLKLDFTWTSTKCKNFYGWHQIQDFPIGKFHMIALNFKAIKNEKKLRGIIAHELIHAWQYDYGKEVDHGDEFARWCAWFKVNYGINTKCVNTDHEAYLKHYFEMTEK